MKSYKVIFSPLALDQLEKLGLYIARKADKKTALSYISKIQQQCKSLHTAPLRGRSRADLHPGLRIIGFRKRVNIAFSVRLNTVVIQGIFYGGQDIDAIIADSDTQEGTL